jgi:LCP family protein required for cell wall assembly
MRMTGPNDGPQDGSAESADPSLPSHLDPRGARRGGAGAGPTGGPAGTGPGGTGRRKRSKKRIAAWIAGGLAGVLVIGAVTGLIALDTLLAKIRHADVFCHSCSRPSGGVVGDLNVLVVGSDSRAGLTRAQQNSLHVGSDAGRRSDTMILLHIPRGGGKAVIVSLPRDSYVVIPAHKDATGRVIPASHNKLNAAYSIGGPELTVQTIEANTHVRIDHYIEVNFLGFVKIVNALGGVTVCTPTSINDPVHYDSSTHGYVGSGLKLPRGRSHIDGAEALSYVRAREFDPTADIGRIKRQQKFMAALLQEATSAGTLIDLPKLYDVLSAAASSLLTDKSFGASQIRRLAQKLHSMSPAHVELLTVPLEPGTRNTAVGNVVTWDPVLAPQLFNDLTRDLPVGGPESGQTVKVTIPPSSVTVTVLNATSTQGLARTVADGLSADGFAIHGTGNAPAGSSPTDVVIRYGPDRADSARTVAAALPGAKLRLDSSYSGPVQVLVGSSFHGVQRVKVVASPSPSGTGISVRTAAQDVCS